MLIDSVLCDYQAKLEALEAGIEQARMHSFVACTVLGLSLLLMCGLAWMAAQRRLPVWYSPLSLPVAVASARRFLRSRAETVRHWRLSRHYRRGLERIEGRWAGTGISGEEYASADHAYQAGLHVFGEGSLFELLCTARTEMGRRRLARYLLEPVQADEVSARQQAVRELAPLTGLRERTALLGRYGFQESKWETFDAWLTAAPVSLPGWLAPALLASSILLAPLLLIGYGGHFAWSAIAPLAAFLLTAGFALRRRTATMRPSLRLLASEVPVIAEGLALFSAQKFDSPKLQGLAAAIHRGPAPRAMSTLCRLLGALDKCDRDSFFYLPARLLAADTQLILALERWRARHGAALRVALDAWAEFEALHALATYAHEHPDDTWPQFCDGAPRLEAEALGHPLLARETCVPNDIALNPASRFYVVSGSNMAGKSTLLRTIGLNAVLAYAGAPVRAQSMTLSPLAICASISITDSLRQGKSRFLAEVDRLRQALESALHGPVLFLIDEIFSGTNSRDRRTASEAVIRALIERGAIGALSTHDLSLTEIAALDSLHGMNVHMGSRDGAGPLDFDYRLRPGITRESNALAIAQLAGVPGCQVLSI